MNSTDTLLLSRRDVAELLSIEECMVAVEQAFKLYASGEAPAPGVLGIHVQDGGFHIKAGLLHLNKSYFVAKINANFAGNNKKYNLPTIQGIIVVSDAENGKLLALMDSIEITILRTGAATGVAAKYLAKTNAKTATIIGCGNQGRVSLRAIMQARRIEQIFAFDKDKTQLNRFAKEMAEEMKAPVTAVEDFRNAVQQSEICVTCTTSTKSFLESKDVLPGTFIAAVGADSEHKQELCPGLLRTSKVVTDLTNQCATIGELHHALKAGLLTVDHVHAELGEIITGKKPGRTSGDEIIIFDSTGTALQDVAAAAIVYEKAIGKVSGRKMNFSELSTARKPDAIKKTQGYVKALRSWFPFK